MRQPSIQFQKILDKTIVFSGGLSEGLSNLEMKPGELFSCINYEELNGVYRGYISTFGYEVWDGTVVSVEIPSDSGKFRDIRFPSDVPVRKGSRGKILDGTQTLITEQDVYVNTSGGDEILLELTDPDEARELRRSQITPVPGEGPLLYCKWYKETVYVIRKRVAEDFDDLYMMEKGTTPGTGGWVQVVEFPADYTSVSTDPEARYRGSLGHLAYEPVGDPNTELLTICNGVDDAVLIHKDSGGSHTIRRVTDVNLPVGLYPQRPLVFENRLYLAFKEGHTFFSELGRAEYDPMLFSGEIYFGSDVHDFIEAPGSALVVILKKGLKILKKIQLSGGILSPVKVETFSDHSSSVPDTAQRMFGTIYYCDYRGMTSLDATEKFGDFQAASLLRRVQKTYLRNKENIVTSIADKANNIYRLFFDNGEGLVVTFQEDKTVRGSTRVRYPDSFTCYDYGFDETHEEKLVAGTKDGFLVFFNKRACSFNGQEISTSFSTAYHSYTGQAVFSNFRKMMLELTCQAGLEIQYRCEYDYRSSKTPRGETLVESPDGSGGIYAADVWSSFVWASSAVNVEDIYIQGRGFNMSFSVRTLSKYFLPHVFHNMTVQYTSNTKRF